MSRTNLFQKSQESNFYQLFLRSGSGTLLVRAGGIAVAMILHVLFARIMGVTQYGYFVYVISWMGFLVLLSTLGLNITALRYISTYRATREWGLLRGILLRSSQLIILASLCVGSVLAAITWSLQKSIGTDLTLTFMVGAGVLPVMSLLILYQEALRALGRVVLGQLPFFLIRPTILLFIVIVNSSIFSRNIDGTMAMTFFFIAMNLSLIIGCIWLWKNLPEQVKSNCAEYKNREWLLTSFPLMIVMGFHFFNTRCDVLMIGIFIDTKQAGIYTVASRIAEFVNFGPMVISQVAAPMISEFHAQGRKWELQRLLKNSAFTIFIISLSIAIVILLFGRIALGLFGKPFLEGYIPVWILVIGQFINSLNACGGFLLTMTGYERQASYLIGISTIINISLNFALIPIYGIIGAAIATATGTIIWNVCLFIFVKKNMGINPTIFQYNNKKMVCSNSYGEKSDNRDY